MITAITCTGHRLEAFKLCRQYLATQTTKEKIQWIIVDDSGSPKDLVPLIDQATLPKNIEAELYQGPRLWVEGLNTQRGNLEVALEHVEGEKIFFWEDDDYYSPRFLEVYSSLLNFGHIVGESNSKYFNLNVPGFLENRNYTHSSLCQTGIRKEALALFVQAVNKGHLFIDIVMWQLSREEKIPMVTFGETNLCIGIKGMPGRANLGAGARLKGYGYDSKLDKLRAWIGDDADLYKPFLKSYGQKEPNKITPARGLQGSQRKHSHQTGGLKGPSRFNPSSSNQKIIPGGQAQKPAPQKS